MKSFWLCFVPLFVAVDAIGALPMYLGLTEGLGRPQRRRVLAQSMLTAMVVALIFLFIGQAIFGLLGITVADFMIAGGTLLFIISMGDIMSTRKPSPKVDLGSLGSVPIGVPLIVGPAVLTTIILLAGEYGLLPTVIATVINILIAGGMFAASGPIDRLLGKSGVRTFSKIVHLILAAIAVMMVRKGIMAFVGPVPH